MRKFDFYEFTATLIPGVVLLFGFTRILQDAWGRAYSPEASASEFTLFVLLSYAAGFAIQSFGNLLEPFVWSSFNDNGKFRWPRVTEEKQVEGKKVEVVIWQWPMKWTSETMETPINRFRRNYLILLTDEQFKVFKDQMKSQLGFDWSADFKTMDTSQWTAIHRHIHAALKKNKLNARSDRFAAGYALARGLFASLFALFIIYVVAWWPVHAVEMNLWILFFLFVAGDCAFMRMNRYGTYVARETYVQFMTIK